MIVVSGLERSGTSLMMQILEDAEYDICYDESKTSDIHNPNGYYELSDGKIILELYENKFNSEDYKDKVIKITSYGIPMIDDDEYKVIYMRRDIREVLDSQRKMMKTKYLPYHREIELLKKLDKKVINHLDENKIEYKIVSYNNLIEDSNKELSRLSDFLGVDVTDSKRVIDKSLYRNRG